MGEIDKADAVNVEQIQLAQRSTAESRYAIAAAVALLLFVAGKISPGAVGVAIVLSSSLTVIVTSIAYWSSFEREKLFRMRFIHELSASDWDGDDMAYEKERNERIRFYIDLSSRAQSIAYLSFALSALLFGASGLIFNSAA